MRFSIPFKVLWDSYNDDPAGEENLKSCIHSGNAGDIIYSLPTIRELGAEHYIINLCSDPGFGGRNIDLKTAHALTPLLLAQPYIKRVTIATCNLPLEFLSEPIEGIDFILDKFRLQDVSKNHLVICHAKALGVYVNLYERWLFVDGENPNEDYIVVSLTPRYRSLPKEYWMKVLSGLDNLVVIGVPEEFHAVSGITGDFITCADYLEMARIIAGGRLFIGNPSLPYAIAEGLKVPRIIELPAQPRNAYPIGKAGYVAPSSPSEARNLIERLLTDSSKEFLIYRNMTLMQRITALEDALRENQHKGWARLVSGLEEEVRKRDELIRILQAEVMRQRRLIASFEKANQLRCQ